MYIAPILAYTDDSKHFLLNTDAKGKVLGAVLYKEHEGKERLIANASRSLKRSEQNYPAHIGLLDFFLQWALTDEVHDYLYGHIFL